MKRKIVCMLIISTMILTVGCGRNSNEIRKDTGSCLSDPSSIKDISDSDVSTINSDSSDTENLSAYEKIEVLADNTIFPSSGTGLYDLSESPKEWISKALESNKVTAGIGGDNEKMPVSDLDTLLKTEVGYSQNYEIHLNDEHDAVITCTNFYNPSNASKPCTVEDCLNKGWWDAEHMVFIGDKDYLENPTSIEDMLTVFGDPTNIYMTDNDTYQTIVPDSLDDFKEKAKEALKDNDSVSYSLIWNDSNKYMYSAARESSYDNYVLSPHLYGEASFRYSLFGEEPDFGSEIISSTTNETNMEVDKTGNSTNDNTTSVKETIDQIVFPENNGKFTTVTLKHEYRNNYFTIDLPSDDTFYNLFDNTYEGYTVERYVKEQHTDSTLSLDSGADYDNHFTVTYDGVQISYDTNTERLARKHADGIWLEENGLKAYVYEDSHIIVSIESGESANLYISFYGNTNKYSLEEYGKYILNLVHLVDTNE